jgi:hypothetical protein
MTNEPAPDEPPPVVKSTSGRVNSTLYLGPPIRGNATAEELTWPVVQVVRRANSTLIDEPPVRGNATAEELTWPVVPTGAGIISAPRPAPAPAAECPSEPCSGASLSTATPTQMSAVTSPFAPVASVQIDALLRKMEALSGLISHASILDPSLERLPLLAAFDRHSQELLELIEDHLSKSSGADQPSSGV